METETAAMQSLIDWSLFLLMLFFSMFAWTKSQKYGWRRLSDISVIALFAFAFAMGEQWYIGHKTIPWCYGIGEEIINRTGWASIAFLTLISLVGMYLARWLAVGYNKVKRLPGTLAPMVVSGVIIIMFLHFSVTAAAYHHKISENEPGGAVVKFARNSAIGVFTAAIDVLKDQNFEPYSNNGKGK